MNEKLIQYRDRIVSFWNKRTKSQKGLFVGSFLLLIAIIVVTSLIAGRTNFVPLYSNLSPQETGQIKATLDSKGIKSKVMANGTTIEVPESDVDTLKVELAADGIPDSGSIDYSFFSKNAGFGMTDNEFNVLKLEATQTELANLLKKIDGVQDAKVMINLPDKSVFIGDSTGEASASVVLNTEPGYKFTDSQIRALYHLVAKSVPNLSTDNIVIMNQYFEYYDLKNENNLSNSATIQSQLDVKKEIERDLQRRIQQMLGTMMGQDKVLVSVTADLDFTQEKSVENLVTPVDPQKMKGIEISAQKLTETYSGKGANATGVPGTGQGDVPGYQSPSAGNSNGDYQKVQETVNSEVNHIKKNIVNSPYKIVDLGIQVMVEPPKANNPASLPAQRVNDIKQILGTIIRTTIDKSANAQLSNQDIQKKIAVSVEPFNGKIQFQSNQGSLIPVWVYILGGLLLLVIIGLIILLVKRNRKNEEEEVEEPTPPVIPDLNVEHETESSLRRKQLEKMAREKPDEFAKLLRSWLTEE